MHDKNMSYCHDCMSNIGNWRKWDTEYHKGKCLKHFLANSESLFGSTSFIRKSPKLFLEIHTSQQILYFPNLFYRRNNNSLALVGALLHLGGGVYGRNAWEKSRIDPVDRAANLAMREAKRDATSLIVLDMLKGSFIILLGWKSNSVLIWNKINNIWQSTKM